MNRPPTLWSAPAGGTDYNKCLTRALRDEGYRVEEPVWSGRWLWEHVRPGDAFLLHWPSFQYAGSPAAGKSLAGALKYLVFLLAMRLRGVRIGWVGHNLLPHKRSAPAWLDVFMRRATIRMCDAIFAHGAGVAGELARHYPRLRRKAPIVIAHGPLAGLYSSSITREEARRRLGIPDDAYAFLMFGLIAPYKGVHLLPPALDDLPPNTHLLIAGRFSDPAYEARIRALVDKHAPGRIHLWDGFVSDEKLPCYLIACDAMAMPYTDSLTSGTAPLALSFGRPVVAPATPFLRDVVGDKAGILYGSDMPLRDALARCQATRFPERELIAHAATQRWDETARRIGKALLPQARPR